MKIHVEKNCDDFNSYRSARVKSLFNVESGANFTIDAEFPIENDDWQIGVVVGRSGSGKTSIGEKFFGADKFYDPTWPHDKPIIDVIAPDQDFDSVTKSFTSVGLGSVPSWLRPFQVLSNGEKFRANLARLITDDPDEVVIDEFTSVVDRQVAQIGSMAFAKAWRRNKGKAVLLSCHYDILKWLQPDWVFDTATGKFAGRGLWQRPKIELEIYQTNWQFWHLFEPHHYLKLPRMMSAKNFVGVVDGTLVAHVAVTTMGNADGLYGCRPARLVVMPEWQGVGVGVRFLDSVCQMWLDGKNRFNKPLPAYFTTSHVGLIHALTKSKSWRVRNSQLYGSSRKQSLQSLVRAKKKKNSKNVVGMGTAGFGGHFRGTRSFKFVGSKPRLEKEGETDETT